MTGPPALGALLPPNSSFTNLSPNLRRAASDEEEEWTEDSVASQSNRHLLSSLLLLAALAALCLSFRDLEPGLMFAQLRSVGVVLPLILLPQGASMALESWGWGLAMAAAGHRVRFSDLLAVRTATEAVFQLMPGGPLLAESLKPMMLRSRAGLSIPSGVGAALYRKYLRLLGQGPYVLVAALAGASALSALSHAWFRSDLLFWATIAFSLVLLALACGFAIGLRRATLAMRTFEMLKRVPWLGHSVLFRTARERFEESDRALRVYFSLPPRLVLLPALASGACWGFEALESWVILRVLGVEVPFHLVLGVDVAISLSRQLLVIVPAGLGVQEAGYLAAFSALGVVNPVESAAAFSILKRSKELLWGMTGLALLSPMRRSTSTAEAPAANRKLESPPVLRPQAGELPGRLV